MYLVYLSIGSNIHPEIHLPKAAELLGARGAVRAVSNAWESHAIGASGQADFLNACILLATPLPRAELKERLVRPVESALGRQRTGNKNEPRTIDLDLILVNGEPLNLERWAFPFVVVPLAELIPHFVHPLTGENMRSASVRMLRETWMRKRPKILKAVRGSLSPQS